MKCDSFSFLSLLWRLLSIVSALLPLLMGGAAASHRLLVSAAIWTTAPAACIATERSA
jgi:hypothetical protein